MEKLIVLVDDLRSFRVMPEGDVKVFRNSASALEWLQTLEPGTVIDEFWFDHDLGLVDGRVDEVWPVIDYLGFAARIEGEPVEIRTCYVHSMNSVSVPKMIQALKSFGYEKVYRVEAIQVFTADYTSSL